MKYKYEDIETVEVKQSLAVHKHDDDYQIIETLEIPVGTKGTVVSMGCNSTDNFVNHYDIEFDIDGEAVDVVLHEDSMDKFLILN